MMSKFLCGVLFMCCLNAYAAIGHVSGSFTDVDRNNRVVTYEAFYPSAVDGDNVAISDGQYPFIVFGHGFLMGYATYQNIWEFIVPNGYVMVFVTTEGGFPDHAAYGQDLVFIAQRFLELNTTSGELFENHLTNLYAFTGHSMGGGASWLAAVNNTSVACLVGLAPAETNPSAIGAAANVTAPLLVLSGSDDTVTPPAENHIPMYEDASSDCKVFVNLVQGSHCGYADSGSLCDIGELGFNGMDRTIQQNITHDLLLMWYNRYLKNEGDVIALLSSYDTSNSNLDMQVSCAVDVEEVASSEAMKLWPNPAIDKLYLQEERNASPHKMELRLFDMMGINVATVFWNFSANNFFEWNIQVLPQGSYLIQMIDADNFTTSRCVRFIKS